MRRTSLSCSDSFSAFFTASSAELFPVLSPGVLEDSGEWAGEGSLTAFFNSSSLRFFFSCFARSSKLVSLVKAIDFQSGDQTGEPAPLGKSVNKKESPPAIGIIDNCGGSG